MRAIAQRGRAGWAGSVGGAVALTLAGLCAGAALASLPRGAGPISLWFGGALGAAVAWSLRSRARLRCDEPAAPLPPSQSAPLLEKLEQFAPWSALLFFLPVFTLPVAPGIDMAMHAALARSLAEGAHELSPAWPGIAPAIYPRGFSALMALASPMGIARASLFASALSMALYQWGAIRLFAALGARRPALLGALAALLSRTPQSWFSWGGDPTALALGLGLFATAIAVDERATQARWRRALAAALLLSGAAAVHPIGAVAASLVFAISTLRSAESLLSLRRVFSKRARGEWLTVLLPLGLTAAVLISIAALGPVLSTRELDWMIGYSRGTEAVVRGPPWQFAWRIWLALGPVLGDPWTSATALGAAYLLLCAAKIRAMADAKWVRRSLLLALFRSLLLVLALGALLAIGPYLPHIGAYLYPSRFAPLLALATAPLIDASFAQILEGGPFRPAPRAATALWLVLLVLAIQINFRVYQHAVPLASRNDLQAIACIAERTTADAVIEGPNGDAAEWIPALTGRRVTAPHKHCSLFDEIDRAIAPLHPSYRFHGEQATYGESLPEPLGAGPPVCAVGAARLWALPASK